ncbi:glycosyltransferase family 25 protein [Komagataeibacter sp. FNDCR2]|uniref:glycosyltransferase family 25 protein n=1 Tax=Komagataeibacter sp. FNDCR2 TaxID=2878682 RepID=UPI001E421CEF|nr:glycosyltransferase family 25 protein [Komagataeibacter sp. FNDCR2]MCE2574441.1 glycosyltransferase family 25 protein [Komagataeibacter sp. FNDCR2]
MVFIYINRDKDQKRREIFLKNNSHLSNIKRFSAIDGNTINREELISRGIITEDCIYINSAIGNALSHISLWNGVVESGKSACIFEDDAVLCHNFEEQYENILKNIGSDWEIILFGYNTDAMLYLDVVPSILEGIFTFDDVKFKKNIGQFSSQNITTQPIKLREAFGLCGYAISPKGAARLTNAIIPLRAMELHIKIVNGLYKNGSLDNFLCAAYREMDAYCCVPPLCVSENDKSLSTMWNAENFYY